MYWLLIILTAIFALGALVLTFLERYYAAAVAWVALLGCFLLPSSIITGWQLTFWGLAALLVLGIGFLGGGKSPFPRVANYYVCGGTLAGAIAGMVISSAGLIIGAVVGALFGVVAFSRTPRGRGIDIADTRVVIPLLATLGLPAVVTISILGHVLIQLLFPL